MEELVGFRPWKLEADKVFARDNGLVALTAVDDCFPFHRSPPELRLVFPVGQFVADCFQILVGSSQAGTGLVDGSKNGDVLDSHGDFRLMFPEEFLNHDDLFSQSLFWRVIRRGIDLGYKVIPRGIARNWNTVAWLPPVQQVQIADDKRDEQERADS